ncbi:MAG: hypothetical protein A2Y10_19660 [Planctomycetes bacterium GWF2_41_51]|nr:MAG: hypothetical protein A2Y10_19660 [Planctomycetes bacterium GWF2_41_51]HBG28197.1 hypothetical protein [Phycisphaerales bacterium]
MKLLAKGTKAVKNTKKVKSQLRQIINPIVAKSLKDVQFLDNALSNNNLTLDCAATSYALLKITLSGQRPALAKSIMNRLYERIKPVIDGHRDKLDYESEVAPVCEWVAFLSGMNLK